MSSDTTNPQALEAPPALQAALQAPPHWRAIEFISDLHLTEASPKTVRGFQRYLDQCQADAVFILGDLFEVWIGDDIASDSFASHTMAQLKRAAATRFMAFMVGNRDFLLKPPLLWAHGVTALHDPCVLTAFDQNLVLSHGDALCLDDQDYQRFRLQVRDTAWQTTVLAKSRAERATLARGLRDASEALKHQAHPVTWADADAKATQQWLVAFGARTLVHGHTHRPAKHQPAVAGAPGNTQRWVLSDWDLDADAPRASALRLTSSGLERVALERQLATA